MEEKLIKFKFNIPYNPNLSKNKRYAFYKSKHKNKDHLNAQNIVKWEYIKAAKFFPEPKKGKFWVGYTWYRKTMRGDVINFLNPICDAIKECLSFDDNYFCVSFIDWELDKNERLEIEIKYENCN